MTPYKAASQIVSGPEIVIGQTVKAEGKWITVTATDGTDRHPAGDYFAERNIRLIDGVTDSGRTEQFIAEPDQMFAVRTRKGEIAPVIITVRDTRTTRETPRITVPIRYERREYGGWIVVHAGTGRHLGWICAENDAKTRDGFTDWDKVTGWSARVDASAFKGDSLTDTGHPLDEVDTFAYNGDGHHGSRSIGTEATRDDAAELIVRRLVDKSATAIFGERHYAVTRWEDRF